MSLDLATHKTAQISPLVLADQMITLAQHADRAGYRVAASRLIGLAYAVLERRPPNAQAASPSSQSRISRTKTA